MVRVGVVGGETHIGEVTVLAGTRLSMEAAAVRPDRLEWARSTFGCEVETDYARLLDCRLDVVAVANENDQKARVIADFLERGVDVIVDKPLAITGPEQDRIEGILRARPERRLLMLLTLRGSPVWMGMRELVHAGTLGKPVFVHVRMAVQLKKSRRPPWFLDSRRSGGLFLDLLIHGLDQVEWITANRIVAVTASMGNLGNDDEPRILDHASVYCELSGGGSALVEGQRLLPCSKGNDYRALAVGTEGYAELDLAASRLTVTDRNGEGRAAPVPARGLSVVADWLDRGELVPQEASLRANRLSLLATLSSQRRARIETN